MKNNMSLKDAKHWGYDLICSLCCFYYFILGMIDYDSFISYDGGGWGKSIDAIIKLLDRSLGEKMVLGLLFVVAMLFLLNAYRKWKKK